MVEYVARLSVLGLHGEAWSSVRIQSYGGIRHAWAVSLERIIGGLRRVPSRCGRSLLAFRVRAPGHSP